MDSHLIFLLDIATISACLIIAINHQINFWTNKHSKSTAWHLDISLIAITLIVYTLNNSTLLIICKGDVLPAINWDIEVVYPATQFVLLFVYFFLRLFIMQLILKIVPVSSTKIGILVLIYNCLNAFNTMYFIGIALFDLSGIINSHSWKIPFAFDMINMTIFLLISIVSVLKGKHHKNVPSLTIIFFSFIFFILQFLKIDVFNLSVFSMIIIFQVCLSIKTNSDLQRDKIESSLLSTDDWEIEQKLSDLNELNLRIAKFLFGGLQYKEIADKCNMSLPNVKKHIRTIYQKYHVNSRTELFLYVHPSNTNK